MNGDSLEAMDAIRITLSVCNPTDPARSREVDFLIDSGMKFSVVPQDILSGLGVVSKGVESVTLADLTCVRRKAGEALFIYAGETRLSGVLFGEEGDSTVLGTLTLQSFGLMLDPYRQEVRPMTVRT